MFLAFIKEVLTTPYLISISRPIVSISIIVAIMWLIESAGGLEILK